MGKDALARLISQDDAYSYVTCEVCGHRFGYAQATVKDGRLVHTFDCTAPGTW